MMREFEIERQFQIKIDIIKANKGIYYIKTNKGERCLKKINYGPQKLLFVYGAKEHLIKNGFKNVDKYFLNIDGEPYALVNEDLYTLSEWLEGRECDFHNIEEVKIAAETLAKLHEASKGYDPPENSKLKSDLGRWPSLMEKRIKSLDKMRDMIRKKNRKSDFDLLYLKSMEFYKDIAKKALNTLNASEYVKLCEIAEHEKGFCHHDYTYHNIILGNDNSVSVIDFDYCKREVRTFDISNFMIKVLKRNNWNIDFANAIIESYNKVSKLDECEYNVLYAYLQFPQRYWRLANRYYYNEVNWGQNTFDSKLESIINEKEEYLKFLEHFKNEYNMDAVIVTSNNLNGKSQQDYADDYFDYNGYGVGKEKSGLLLLIDMENRNIWISTSGEAIKYFTDNRIDNIVEDITSYLKNGDYFGGCNVFINDINNYVKEGIPTNKYVKGKPTKNIVFIGLAAGAIVASSVCFLVVNSYKNSKSVSSVNYADRNSIVFTRKKDRFINTYTTRTKIERNNNNNNSGGTSSTHTSSSGNTHGGGGGSF